MIINIVDESVTSKAEYKYGRIRGGVETIGVQFEPFNETVETISAIELSDDEYREQDGR